VAANLGSTEAFQRFSKQAGVTLLFLESEIHECLEAFIGGEQAEVIPRDEIGGAATIAELELLQGAYKLVQNRTRDIGLRSLPIGLRPLVALRRKCSIR